MFLFWITEYCVKENIHMKIPGRNFHKKIPARIFYFSFNKSFLIICLPSFPEQLLIQHQPCTLTAHHLSRTEADV